MPPAQFIALWQDNKLNERAGAQGHFDDLCDLLGVDKPRNYCFGGVGNDPRYTPTTTFATFPFPAGLTPRDTAQSAPTGAAAEAIASASRRLNELRDNWLNPADWVDWSITPEEQKAGFPSARSPSRAVKPT